MTGGLNFKVLSDWRSSVSNAFQQLRRTIFVYENDFEWQTLPMEFDGNGLTYNTLAIEANYLKIGKLLFIRCQVNFTASAGAVATVYLTIPYTFPTGPVDQITTGFVSGGAATYSGIVTGVQGTNKIGVNQSTLANYALAGAVINFNAFFEVL